MKKGPPFKHVAWPPWAIKRMKQLGLSEDLLNEALKVGIRTFEVDCCQLSQRVKSVNETWNTPAFSAIDGEEHSLNGSSPPERLEIKSRLDMDEPDTAPENERDAKIGPCDPEFGRGQFPEGHESITNIEIDSGAGV